MTLECAFPVLLAFLLNVLGVGGGYVPTPDCVSSAFTFHEFMQWLKTVTLPLVGLGLLSLLWEILQSGYR